MASLYESINVERYEIRLLRLDLTDDDESIISGTLVKASLLDEPDYTALSYCWGDETITVDAVLNEIPTPITTNLDKALRYLRKRKKQFVWADAICINQADLTEKSQQVRNMKQIYHQAIETIAWLGDGSGDDAEDCLKLLGSSAGESNTFLADGGNDAKLTVDFWGGLVHLFERPYWRRRWIIQEVVVSSQLWVVCGETCIGLEAMEGALGMCRASQSWEARHKAASSYYATLLELHRQNFHGPISMLHALFCTSGFLSKDPRDVIFALFGMSTDGAALLTLPSYHLSPDEVAVSFTRALLRKYGFFDLLWMGERAFGQRSQTLPSWAPDWLSGANIPHTHFVPEMSQLLPSSDRQKSLGQSTGSIVLPGVVLGTVTSLTASLKDQPADGSVSENAVSSVKPRQYYETDILVRLALLSCIVPTKTVRGQALKYVFAWTPYGRIVHLLKSLEFATNPSSSESGVGGSTSSSSFEKWLNINKDYQVAGKPLLFWLKQLPWPAQFYFLATSVRHTWSSLPLVLMGIALCLILFLCTSGLPILVILVFATSLRVARLG